MTYYKDLSLYDYWKDDEKATIPVLNIGWLSPSEPFETGITSQEFKNRLHKFCSHQNIVMPTLGFHVCEFCSNKYKELRHQHADNKYWGELRGNGEIRIIGKSILYAAPALIYHYVMEHNYKPPQEFIDAILASPQPESSEYKALLNAYK